MTSGGMLSIVAPPELAANKTPSFQKFAVNFAIYLPDVEVPSVSDDGLIGDPSAGVKTAG